MTPTIPQILFFIGASGLAAFLALQLRGSPLGAKATWAGIATLWLAFLSLTAAAFFGEGPLGFWYEHTRTLWSSQVWFDLVIASAVAWAGLAKRARRVGMTLPLWALAIPLTGSIGLLAMWLRLTRLERREGAAVTGA